MRTICVELPGRGYDIHIAGGLLAEAGALLARRFPGLSRCAVVSDETVWGLYGQALQASLDAAGIAALPVVLPPGEGSKTPQNLEVVCNALLEGGLFRDEPVLALGGGVVGDLAGLAASVYRRGVPLVQLPTTLLAQVDSSVGGKTAVNLPGGKNMLGTFHQPSLVIIDTDTLDTLPARELASGMAEVIKYGCIRDESLLQLLEDNGNPQCSTWNIEEIVARCCEIKAEIVRRDEHDRGERMLLNFGHTFAHALETLGDYRRYTHGEAVALGMRFAHDAPRLRNLLARYGLPTETDYTLRDMLPILKKDKKNDGLGLRLVVLERFGKAAVRTAKAVEKFPSGAAVMPPSKSVLHRILICSLLAGVEPELPQTLSQDIAATRSGMRLLLSDEQEVTVDCGESGTTLRFLRPIAAALGKNARFTGKGRLMERPEPEVARRGNRYTLPGDVSSQFVSGLLLALPLSGGGTVTVRKTLQSAPYVELTRNVMRRFGVEVRREGDTFTVPGDGYRPPAAPVEPEGDWSQAAFFLVAAALGRPVETLGLDEASAQGDRAILDILRACGAEVGTGPSGGLTVRGGGLRGLTVDMSDIPDLAPPVALLLTACGGESRMTGCGRLRLKESDRLESIAGTLSRLGADIRAEGDELRVRGTPSLRGGLCDSHNDHRIAMMAACAAIRCEQPVLLTGWEAVNKSFPDFWAVFEGGRT